MAEQINSEKNVNELANMVAEAFYRNQLHALNETLVRFRVMKRTYTILGDQDEAVCMIYDEGNWKVYFSERGHESNCKVTTDVEEACRIMLHKLSEDRNEYEQMIKYFEHEMETFPDDRGTSLNIYQLLKDGMRKISKSVAVF